VGARRARRAFRYFVAASVIFTLMLACAEVYLQQEQPERLYTVALTQQDESSSRVFLRQAVLQDKQTQEVRTPKYLEALAPREEEDKILPTYKQAFELDKTNPVLAINYGCRLLEAGTVQDAAEKFDVAAQADRTNALPLYLKAMAQPGVYDSPAELSESIALIAQANATGRRVLFPRPLWSSMLPFRGREYARLCRESVDDCSKPVYKYLTVVMNRADEDIQAGRTQYWDAWLQTLQIMGERIAMGALPTGNDEQPRAGGALQAQLGITVQLDAIEKRLAIVQMRGAPPNADLAARKAKLEAALQPLIDFENSRDERIERDRSGYLLPGEMFAKALLGTFIAYLIARIAWNRRGRRIVVSHAENDEVDAVAKAAPPEAGMDPELTIRHTPLAKAVLVGGAAALLVTLFVLLGLQVGPANERAWIPVLSFVWTLELLVLLGFGLLYPRLALPAAAKAAANHAGGLEQEEETLRLARLHRRRAAYCLRYRYYGILLGLILTVFSVWTVGYRVVTDLYPWQTPLLTTGLIEEEASAVNTSLSHLG
jgi:hypothetical protein